MSLSGCAGSIPVPRIKKMRTGPTNPNLKKLIKELKILSSTSKGELWRRIALDLEKPARKKNVVNLSRINKFGKESEIIVVPGKVLASGAVDKKLTVAAWQFSEQAKDKISRVKGTCLTIPELLKKNPKPSQVRIIG